MKISIEKLKRADTQELIKQYDLADEEISNDMYPVSHARFLELEEYKTAIYEELKIR